MARYRVEIVNTATGEVVEIYETNRGAAWERLIDWIIDRQLATTEQARIITLDNSDESAHTKA